MLARLRLWGRKKEVPLFGRFRWIAEFWNTLSNLPFIVIGVLRLYALQEIQHTGGGTALQFVERREAVLLLYRLYTCAGIASGFHHMCNYSWTIIVDWIPIFLSMLIFLTEGFLPLVSVVSWFKLVLAFYVLLTDHMNTIVPVPFGHVMWHLLAALAIDAAYQDVT